ncbi:MAG: hypothetical protein KDK39_02215 [Leptospiraceae bacterium]|nr:hypothetical protein [Leptospiraceae bacterium]
MSEEKASITGIYAPSDKRRIALLSGAVGQADRITIKGQVVDVPVSEDQKEEEWDHFLGLPLSLINEIHPLQDFAMSLVRRPRLRLEVLNTTPQNFNPERLDESAILYQSEEFTAGDDSFFSHSIAPTLAPGDYVVRVILKGIDSLRQSVSDLSYVRHEHSAILKTNVPIGYGKLRVLDPEYSGFIITSDIDQTFLDTPMHSRRGLLEVLFQKPESRRHIPGMPAFYRQLQNSTLPGARDRHIVPTLFISASPHFFRRSLSVVFEQHDIEINALHLKYLVSTFDNMLNKIRNSALNLNELLQGGMQEALDRSLKFVGSSLASLFDQIAYKLITLLENRLMQPSQAREILMGDNTEGDYFIFVLYQYLLMNRLGGKELENYLYNLNFQDREVLTRDSAKEMVRLAQENQKRHGASNPVAAVWINRSHESPATAQMCQIIKESLPESLQDGFLDDAAIQKPIACYTGVGFALAALDASLMTETGVREVIDRAIGREYLGTQIDQAIIKTTIQEFEFRQAHPEIKDTLYH